MLTLELVDRALFERLRVDVVAGGYLPDWRSFSGASAESDYQAALNLLTHPVEVFGVGLGKTRGKVDYNRVTVDRSSVTPGLLKGSGVGYYLNTDGVTYTKFEYRPSTLNLTYEVRIFTQTTRMSRVLIDIVLNSVGYRGYIKALDSSFNFNGESFFTELRSMVNVTSADVVEWLFVYEVSDVFVQSVVILDANIPRLSSVELSKLIDSSLVEDLQINNDGVFSS